jgi:hypothetical protein
MRADVPTFLELGRVRSGDYRTTADDGMMGAFLVQGPKGEKLRIISSGADQEFGWEHVSVSIDRRAPNWPEMCFVKNLFWDEEECVVQYHPPVSEYVNFHPNCLHLWRPINASLPVPPSYLVGPKDVT